MKKTVLASVFTLAILLLPTIALCQESPINQKSDIHANKATEERPNHTIVDCGLITEKFDNDKLKLVIQILSYRVGINLRDRPYDWLTLRLSSDLYDIPVTKTFENENLPNILKALNLNWIEDKGTIFIGPKGFKVETKSFQTKDWLSTRDTIMYQFIGSFEDESYDTITNTLTIRGANTDIAKVEKLLKDNNLLR